MAHSDVDLPLFPCLACSPCVRLSAGKAGERSALFGRSVARRSHRTRRNALMIVIRSPTGNKAAQTLCWEVSEKTHCDSQNISLWLRSQLHNVQSGCVLLSHNLTARLREVILFKIGNVPFCPAPPFSQDSTKNSSRALAQNYFFQDLRGNHS